MFDNVKRPIQCLTIADVLFNADIEELKKCTAFKAPDLPELDGFPIPVKGIRDRLVGKRIHLKTEEDYLRAIMIFSFFDGTVWSWHRGWNYFEHEGHTFTFSRTGFLKEIHDTQETISLTHLKETLRIFLKDGIPEDGSEPTYRLEDALAYLEAHVI